MPTARTRKLAAALTALLISNALASQASPTENGFAASTVNQQRNKDDRQVGNAALAGLAASDITTFKEVCVETSIRRYDPYSERIVTIDTKVVCH